MAVATLLIAVACALQACAVLLVMRSARLTPKLSVASPPPAGDLPLVSVVVPARNEERNIEACLLSIAAQNYPALEIVVVDDQSADETPAILARLAAADPRIRLIAGAELPAGWMGKPHALEQAVRHTRGSLLLFVDADVRLHPACVRSAVAYLEKARADLLTLFPRVVTGSFWEHVVQPVIVQLVVTAFRAERINDPRDRAASANGPFLLFRRTAYEEIGGHAAVRDEIVEDLVLARLVKASGRRLVYCLGPELVSLRMYQSFAEIWNGWSKNFYAGIGGSLSAAIAGGAAILAILVVPWMLVPWVMSKAITGAPFGAVGAAAALGLVVAAAQWRRQLARHYGVTARFWYLQPLGFLIVVAILGNSAARARTRRAVSWRGRPAVAPTSHRGS